MSYTQQNTFAGLKLSSLFCALSLTLSLSLPSLASAFTLGPISVLSNLGEPLQAEIEIFDLQGDQAQDLDIGLASETEFTNAGNTRSIVMESLKLRVTQQGRRRMITITTDRPLDQPIYGLLLEFRADGESKIAEFAVLPEEPVNMAEPAITSEPVATDTVQPDQVESSLSDSSDVADKSSENLALNDAQQNQRQHEVLRGQNLTVIARKHSIADADLNKFIAATYGENPDAFIKNNLHYLKAGAVLALPSDEAVSMVDDRAARKTITTQWQTFKDLVASMDPMADKAANGQPTRSISRRLSQAKQEATKASGDQLTLSALTRSENASKNKTEEEAIATKKAAEEAGERVRLLEKNVLDLKTALETNPLTTANAKKSDSDDAATKEENLWGMVSSPARDLMMQGATVILLAALVILAFMRRQTNESQSK
jgi:pilus assembly protein FimV